MESPNTSGLEKTMEHPKVSAYLWMNPPVHSFSSSHAPTLNLTLVSHHPEPITIYTDDLAVDVMLLTGAFVIFDLGTGAEIQQSKRTHCRTPLPERIRIPLHEHLFHSLIPGTPLTLTTSFSRKRESTGGKPLSKSDPGFNDDGVIYTCGVDGLEPGREYALMLADNPRVRWDVVRWWEYGSKKEVLEEGLDGRKVHYEKGPHQPLVIDTSGFKGLLFECVE